MRPFVSQVGFGEGVRFWVEMLPGAPRPDGAPIFVDLNDSISPHAPLVLGARQAAPNPRLHLRRYALDGEIDGASGFGAATVVMMRRITMLPDHVALPVDLHQRAAIEDRPDRKERTRLGWDLA